MEYLINYFAIVVSAIVSILLSYVWYMVLFKSPYIAALNKTKEQMAKGPNFPTALLIQLVGNSIMAFVLAWLINALGYVAIENSLPFAIFLWMGFVVAVIGPMYAFEAHSFKLFLINSGAVLVSFLATASILSLWR